MKLYVVRHGESEPFADTDSARNLTHRGKEDTIDLGVYLSREGVEWDAIVVSPYNRARQTLANILLSFPKHAPVLVEPAITPENLVEDAFSVLEKLADKQSVLFVSHMPLVSGLIATLVAGHELETMNYFMVTASVAELEFDVLAAGAAKLNRLLSPPYEV